jgi:arylsulfatase A-like enzyme
MDAPHILLISLETLRRDHLGCYGHARPLMPNLDRLARNGVRFRDSVANCGWTLPQHMTLMTGLYPLTHGVTLFDNAPLDPRFRLLAEQLQEQGYRTFAGVSQRNNFGGGAVFGFDRGFDEHVPGAEYNQHMPWTTDFVVDRFRENSQAGPCFVYVHVNDSHEPFVPPEPWYSMWGETYRDKYAGELSYVDHYLGQMWAALDGLGVLDETLIVVFADHGTEFGEHGFYEKKCNLYREILDVPLVVHWPGHVPAGRVVEGLVESVQVAPTILDLAGLPPLPRAQGKSLKPRIERRSAEPPEYVCSQTVHNHQREYGPAQFDHWAVQTLDWKLIRSELHAEPGALHSDWKRRFQTIMLRAGFEPAELHAGTVIRELYDLRVDPGEQRSLIRPDEAYSAWPRYPRRVTPADAHRIAEELESRLDRWIEETRAAGQR